MSLLLSKKADDFLKRVVDFYPKPNLPADKADWDMGHQCLFYFSKALPLKEILIPSYLQLVSDRIRAGLEPSVSEELDDILQQAINCGDRRLRRVRKTKVGSITIDLIKKHRAANCGELGELAYKWLRANGVNAHLATGSFCEGAYPLMDKHLFVFYHKQKGKSLSFKQMVRQLDNPDIGIVDLWAQKCGSARDVLNDYCRLFTFENCLNDMMPMDAGLNFVVAQDMLYTGARRHNDVMIGLVDVASDNVTPQMVLFSRPKLIAKRKGQRMDKFYPDYGMIHVI